MSPLEQNIIESLHLLSDEARSKARLVLGDSPSFTKKKKNIKQIISNNQVRANIRKALKI